jgi:hypothetical protein
LLNDKTFCGKNLISKQEINFWFTNKPHSWTPLSSKCD